MNQHIKHYSTYHAILINKQFTDQSFPATQKVFAKKLDGDWEIYGVGVDNESLEAFIIEVQQHIRPNEPWYAHVYNDSELIVIFKDKVFHVLPDSFTWKEIFEYGKALSIPEKQLDFWPNTFSSETAYFQN